MRREVAVRDPNASEKTRQVVSVLEAARQDAQLDF